MDDGAEPIADDEELYRRVPLSMEWYDSSTGLLNPEAFAPHKTRDVTGLSVFRAKYKSIEEAAQGRPGRSYYVAVLRAGDLRQHGVEVVTRALLNDPGHAELPDLNAENRKESATLEIQRLLVELCIRVEGPFAHA